ncbi:MAG: ElyC/SanA/YdcF family protein [Erysipelotrichaceae bacterium]|nr:ElyC/SanA/YdcF family protein [Erysipelotrichaceae bacterium]
MRLLLLLIVIYAIIIIAFSYDFKAKNADYLIIIPNKIKNDIPDFQTVAVANKAAMYLGNNRECKAIVTGFKDKNCNYSMASSMTNLLDERKIYSSRIICEDKAQNLEQQIKNSLLLTETNKKIAICCSDYKALRCKILASKLGYKVNVVCSRSLGIDQIINIPFEEALIIKALFTKF